MPHRDKLDVTDWRQRGRDRAAHIMQIAQGNDIALDEIKAIEKAGRDKLGFQAHIDAMPDDEAKLVREALARGIAEGFSSFGK